jgi:hypothetical protein
MTGKGRYYEIDLFRETANCREMTVIGVGLEGQVVSYRYRSNGYDGNIRQYNGMDAEALARQMCEQSDPQWSR